MRDGECPKCGKRNVYRCHVPGQGGGISSSGDNSRMLHVRDVYRWEYTANWETFLCLECGYYENYLLDKALLTKITANPQQSAWKKVSS